MNWYSMRMLASPFFWLCANAGPASEWKKMPASMAVANNLRVA
jgi:hypothetical protein